MTRLACIALTLTLTGCAGSSSAPTDSSTTPAAHPKDKQIAVRAAAHYFDVNFQGTTWYDSIKGFRMESGALYVKTNLYPDSDADGPANAICNALGFWKPAPRTVHVVSSTGKWIGC